MSGDRMRRPGELVFVVALVIFSALALWQAWLISGFSSPSSPGIFPMLAAGTMLVSGLLILTDTARKRPDSGLSTLQSFLRKITPGRWILFAALMVAYILALEPFGFLPSTFVFLLASIALLYRGSNLVTLAVSVVGLAAIFVVFRYVFGVVLPKGSLF